MSDLSDAISVTGAIAGKVLSTAVVTIPLSAGQRTALVTFVQTLTQWPGQPSHIQSLVVSRDPTTGGLVATLTGYIVSPDAATALAAKTAGSVVNILGSA
jgi:hypothetical protein